VVVIVDAGRVMSSVTVDAAGIRVIVEAGSVTETMEVIVEAGRVTSSVSVDVLVSKSVPHSLEMCTEMGVAYKVTSGNVEVTVAVIVDIEVIVPGAWQDDVGEDVEEADVENVEDTLVVDVIEDNVYVKQ
jgi:hypothetical protein